MKRLLLLPFCLLLIHCGKVNELNKGKYSVADKEYSSQNYVLERDFEPGGRLVEQHTLNHCLLMEMNGSWKQKGGELTLRYNEIRNRESCHQPLPEFVKDSVELKIPIRKVDDDSFESFLPASEGKPDKWITWLKAP